MIVLDIKSISKEIARAIPKAKKDLKSMLWSVKTNEIEEIINETTHYKAYKEDASKQWLSKIIDKGRTGQTGISYLN